MSSPYRVSAYFVRETEKSRLITKDPNSPKGGFWVPISCINSMLKLRVFAGHLYPYVEVTVSGRFAHELETWDSQTEQARNPYA